MANKNKRGRPLCVTPGEYDYILCLARGKTTREVHQQFKNGEMLARLRKKLGVRSSAGLVAVSLLRGLITFSDIEDAYPQQESV